MTLIKFIIMQRIERNYIFIFLYLLYCLEVDCLENARPCLCDVRIMHSSLSLRLTVYPVSAVISRTKRF